MGFFDYEFKDNITHTCKEMEDESHIEIYYEKCEYDKGWHLSKTDWSDPTPITVSTLIKFCPFCGKKLEGVENE